MAAPNIGSIAVSLRNCELEGREGASPLYHSPAAPTESVVVTVELNSDSVLPKHWEGLLDMRTGEVFYVNWKNGGRTTEDPGIEIEASVMAANYDSSEDRTSDDVDVEDEGIDGDVEDRSSFAGDIPDYEAANSGNSSSSFSRASSNNLDACGAGGDAGVLILVVAGCKSCFMYFMVPKGAGVCPKCGGCLLHIGSN